MTQIYLESSQVPPAIVATFGRRKYSVVTCESVTVPADAGLWQDGSREVWRVVQLSSGSAPAMPGQNAAPWDGERRNFDVRLRPGFAVGVERTFQGRDMGVLLYVHPADAAPLLPAPAELTDTERLVLQATATLKSSYGGKDRYQMMREKNEGAAFPSREQWDDAKETLIARRLLMKNGAITPAGRNLAR